MPPVIGHFFSQKLITRSRSFVSVMQGTVGLQLDLLQLYMS
jgi:hypothetical protein